MPGKQMAIDVDLSAGLIDEKTKDAARSWRTKALFGAMDALGAVRDDAVAGLLIALINIGGIIIGVAQQG